MNEEMEQRLKAAQERLAASDAKRDFLPESELEDRRVYEIRSRNLTHGVWVAEKHGFIGIRQKFNDLYLFMEYHYDHDPYVGTVRPVRPLDVVVPDDIDLMERLPGAWCSEHNRIIEFVNEAPEGQRTQGRWRHLDDGSWLDREDWPTAKTNARLFELLEASVRTVE